MRRTAPQFHSNRPFPRSVDLSGPRYPGQVAGSRRPDIGAPRKTGPAQSPVSAGLSETHTAAQKEWLLFLVRFARVRSGISISRQSGTTICAVAAAGPLLPHLPEPDLGLVF